MKAFLEQLNRRRLQAYAADPGLLKEHYGIEELVLAGGYGYRQILELVQNGADAILEAHEQDISPADGNRIHVLLRESQLYVANTGAPLSEEGLDALLRSHSSPKRGNQIGRFGLGFKSLLKLGGCIDLFTGASGAIRFDPQRCRDELKQQFNVRDAPCLRLAWPLDEAERAADRTCTELAWAETIVRVEVRGGELYEHLRQEIRAFPAEFLLFFPVTTVLTLDSGEQRARELRLERDGDQRVLPRGGARNSLTDFARSSMTNPARTKAREQSLSWRCRSSVRYLKRTTSSTSRFRRRSDAFNPFALRFTSISLQSDQAHLSRVSPGSRRPLHLCGARSWVWKTSKAASNSARIGTLTTEPTPNSNAHRSRFDHDPLRECNRFASRFGTRSLLNLSISLRAKRRLGNQSSIRTPQFVFHMRSENFYNRSSSCRRKITTGFSCATLVQVNRREARNINEP